MVKSKRLIKVLQGVLLYSVLIAFALVMIFPFLVMLFTSFKNATDTFRFPPKLLPREQLTVEVDGFDEPLPVYYVEVDGQSREFVLIERSVRVGLFAPEGDLENTVTVEIDQATPVMEDDVEKVVIVGGEEYGVFEVPVNGAIEERLQVETTALGRFADPNDLEVTTLQNLRLSDPVDSLALDTTNYSEVVALHGMDRSLSNTALVTILVVLGQLTTSVLGGYAFARLRFPGRDILFLAYLGTIMIPFAVLITPLYQLMVMIGWVDKLAALVIPWVFTAYGTFLMRQFFISIPRDIEEAAFIDGANRFQILWRIFLPASTPALATLATFTFLYAWNSFFWPLVIINTGNDANRVLTLALMVLGGRAADSPNLVLAGASIAVLPPVLIYIFFQRFFVESQTSSGVKG